MKKAFWNGEEQFAKWQRTGLERSSFETRSKMAKFRPIKKLETDLERWKDETTGKEWQKLGLLTPRKIRKSGKARSKKD